MRYWCGIAAEADFIVDRLPAGIQAWPIGRMRATDVPVWCVAVDAESSDAAREAISGLWSKWDELWKPIKRSAHWYPGDRCPGYIRPAPRPAGTATKGGGA